jgi:3-hydroxyisobutyrate dehydrogenase
MARVGFIGVGNMGGPMARNLVKAGHAVKVYDLSEEAVNFAVQSGAKAAQSVKDAARGVEFAVTMLPVGDNVRAVFLNDGVLAAGDPGTVLIDSSTIDVETARAVHAAAAERGYAMLDAPVSGGVGGAVAGTLAIMVGGDAADLEEARPALAAMGSNIIHVGAVGAGEVAKLCNNLISGTVAVAVSEAFRIGEAFGVDLQILTDVIAKSSGATWVMEHMHPVPGIVDGAASSRQYTPGFMTDLMAKDLGLAVSAARDKRVPVVVAPAAQQLYRMASSHGLGRKDFSSVYQFLKPSSDDAPV